MLMLTLFLFVFLIAVMHRRNHALDGEGPHHRIQTAAAERQQSAHQKDQQRPHPRRQDTRLCRVQLHGGDVDLPGEHEAPRRARTHDDEASQESLLAAVVVGRKAEQEGADALHGEVQDEEEFDEELCLGLQGQVGARQDRQGGYHPRAQEEGRKTHPHTDRTLLQSAIDDLLLVSPPKTARTCSSSLPPSLVEGHSPCRAALWRSDERLVSPRRVSHHIACVGVMGGRLAFRPDEWRPEIFAHRLTHRWMQQIDGCARRDPRLTIFVVSLPRVAVPPG
mmetsp:Transcript_45165/g.127522  ORF Transcript_45165/g.127522 Transcript_45165/m.127522 type:complete len:279 (-) Transcript_45165:83-919(-)